MREILFRGISIGYDEKGSWVYGGILHQTDHYGDKVDKYFIIDGTDTQDYDIGYEYEVDPETVGQYTGLKDKNGKEIFEGDIIKWDPKEWGREYSEVVEWDYELLEMRRHEWADFCEIVGNIHDNPELLKEVR